MEAHASERDHAPYTTVVDSNRINTADGEILAAVTSDDEMTCNSSSTTISVELDEARNDQSDVCPSISATDLQVVIPMLTYWGRTTNAASHRMVQRHSAIPLLPRSLKTSSALQREDTMSTLCSIAGLKNPSAMDRM
jgi:hypothetical protein